MCGNSTILIISLLTAIVCYRYQLSSSYFWTEIRWIHLINWEKNVPKIKKNLDPVRIKLLPTTNSQINRSANHHHFPFYFLPW